MCASRVRKRLKNVRNVGEKSGISTQVRPALVVVAVLNILGKGFKVDAPQLKLGHPTTLVLRSPATSAATSQQRARN